MDGASRPRALSFGLNPLFRRGRGRGRGLSLAVLAHIQLADDERDQAVTDLIDLVVAVDGILQTQAKFDTNYFVLSCDRIFSREETDAIHDTFLKAYRWQYILSGVQVPQFGKVLTEMITPEQFERIGSVLATIS